ncbi:MAG: PIG-L family deacetylase [Deltaproteobacteria bacterium]|nr:PIG-L family deacetylase [Deltaproteobacteria bacterium]
MTSNKKYASWLPFVEMFSKANALGQKISASAARQLPTAPRPPESANTGPRVLLCSPHPDDEILTGALPLRLRQEENATVINLAITLGSEQSRKTDRLHELEKACRTAGFQYRLAAMPLAFANINAKARLLPDWPDKVKTMSAICNDIRPDIIFLPHSRDNHATHEGVHLLVMDALAAASSKATKIVLVETEFWQPMRNPNLMIGLRDEDLALLLTALNMHQGELSRNPYHLSQPSRMVDNVRRGRELMGRRDSQSNFLFGVTG